MVLYHVVSTYQLICAMVHKKIYHDNQKTVLFIGDFMINIYPQYEQLAQQFFDEVYVFPYMQIEHNPRTITEDVIEQYHSLVDYDIRDFNKAYILGAHFYFSEIFIHNKIQFDCFEESVGMLSQPERLERLVRKKFKVQADWAKQNGLFDLSNPFINNIFCLYRQQTLKCKKIHDFDVMALFEKTDSRFKKKCISFFLSKKYVGGKEKKILITEHFYNLGVMSEKKQALFYKSLVKKYCEENQLIVKPHPSDMLDYSNLFPEAEVITDRFPSELLPFLFVERPSEIMTMGSTGVCLLEPYFKIQYIGGSNWSEIYLDHSRIHKYMMEENIMQNSNNYIKPVFSKNNIPVAISCSNEYVKYLSVLLQSILDYSKKDNNYDILILNRGIDERNQFLIKQQCKQENFSVRFISTLEYIEGGNFYTEGLSIEAYFRMFLTDIMSNYEKTLYLDVDTFALTDIAEVFNIDIGDNYIAAAIDVNIVASYVAENHWKPYIDDVIKLDNPYEYVQSGVMVLNLKKMRQDFSLEYLIEKSTSENWRLYDQDVLNHICKNNIFILDPIYNVINTQEGRLQNIEKYAPKDIKERFFKAYKSPKIVHFVGKKKPWISFNTDYAEYFWLAARKTPFYESLLINRITKIDLLDIKNQIMQIKKGTAKTAPVTAPTKSTVPVVKEHFKFTAKNNDAVKDNVVALFRCQSTYQLLNAILIKTTLLNQATADIILTNATDFSSVSEKLERTNIFRNIIFSEDIPKTYLDWRGFDQKKQKEITENPKKYILPVDIKEDYTDYYIAVADEYNKIFYYYMLHKGISTKIHLYEDGINSYILNNVVLCKNDFINHEFYDAYAFDKNIIEHLVHEPSVVVEKVPSINYTEIPKMDTLPNKSMKVLKKIYTDVTLPKQKYIFLEEAFFEDGIASTDIELLEDIADIIGKENIIVKMHPRNKIDRFSSRGFEVMDNTVIPWEIVLLNSDISEKVFLTISSTAAISAALAFDKEFKAIYMYKVMSLGKNIHVRQPKFTEFMQRAKNHANRSQIQTMVPSSKDELIEDLIYVEKGV